MNHSEQINFLVQKLHHAGFNLSEKQVHQFSLYLDLLLRWNKKTNLISRRDEDNVIKRHFLESVSLLDVIEISRNVKVVDVGSGAGFPGVPLKIVRPDLDVMLLDSKRYRILFLTDVVRELDLQKIVVQKGRAEDFSQKSNYMGQYDHVFARAVSQLDNLYKWAISFLKTGGSILAFKGGNIEVEINSLQQKKEILIKMIPVCSGLVKKERDIVIVQVKKIIPIEERK